MNAKLWHNHDQATPIEDIRVAKALASCHNLKKLHLHWGEDSGCVFGHNGLEGLRAMAAGCPLLTEAALCLTARGVHYLGTHCANLKNCEVENSTYREELCSPEGYPSIEELQTLYPAVHWAYTA